MLKRFKGRLKNLTYYTVLKNKLKLSLKIIYQKINNQFLT